MEVILKKDVKGTGKAGEIVKVSDGFARNKLIPGGFAVEATEANKRAIAREKAKAEEKYAADKAAAEAMAKKLTAAPVVVKTKVGDNGKLFGSITSMDIAQAVSEQLGTEIDKKKIVLDKTVPRNRNEQEIAGYRDVLNTIHRDYDYIPIRSTLILQLHRDLYKFRGPGAGGFFKNADNTINDVDENGNGRFRFQPVSSLETPEAVEQLCAAYDQVLKEMYVDPLLIMPMFILDFLCINPFRDGSGRMSRLLTLLLLYQAGYYVGKYVSIEALIERTKDSY